MPIGVRIVDEISQQSDVVLSNPQNNEVLTYDFSIHKWVNKPLSSGSVESSKVFSYDGDNRLHVITDSFGTKTFSYDVDGKLFQIIGTGIYTTKTFSYDVDGKLIGISVS